MNINFPQLSKATPSVRYGGPNSATPDRKLDRVDLDGKDSQLRSEQSNLTRGCFIRPALAVLAGHAVALGIGSFVMNGSVSGLMLATPAIALGGAIGAVIGVANQPKPAGALAAVERPIQAGVNGLVGASQAGVTGLTMTMTMMNTPNSHVFPVVFAGSIATSLIAYVALKVHKRLEEPGK